MVRVAVTGATGRMGRAVLAAAAGRADVTVGLAVSRDPDEGTVADDEGTVAGFEVVDAADLPTLLGDREPDVLVDFTAPESSIEYVGTAADAGVAAVVGTTGFDDGGFDRLRAASERVPVLRAANFSRGVQALLAAVREVAARLPGHDVEVTETHRAGKRDAPSGTAKTLVEAVEDVRGDLDRVHGREGHAPRRAGEIGVHARRAGGVSSQHEILFADDHEVVSLRHRSTDRGVYAEGALDAAAWLAGRDPGWYEFAEVVAAEGGEPA